MNRRRIKKAIIRIIRLPSNKRPDKYFINKIRHFWLKVTRSTSVAYPSTVMLELTSNCNLSCTICPRESEFGKEMEKGNMRADEAKKVIDLLNSEKFREFRKLWYDNITPEFCNRCHFIEIEPIKTKYNI